MIKPIITAAIATVALGLSAEQKIESRAYYSTNPDGAVGKYAQITIDGEFDDWDESMIISTGGANDMCTAFKGSHENCVLDMYALYAAWDDQNLYIAWQMCNTGDTWAREGDGPLTDYGRIGDVPLQIALSINPRNVPLTGRLSSGGMLWEKVDVTYSGEESHTDHLLMMSGKPGLGTPAMFVDADGKGNTDYGSGCKTFSANGISYKMKTGFQPANLWRQMTFADFDYDGNLLSDPEMVQNVYDADNYVDILSDYYNNEYRLENDMKPHDTTYDSFYEIKIPFKALGINREYLETYGIGARVVATRGESGIDCLPHDPSMIDNVWGSYASDKSTSHEKDDNDNITWSSASIGKIRGNAEDYPEPDTPIIDPDDPDDPETPGEYRVYLRPNDAISSWTTPMVWIWDEGNSNKNYTGGTWPGSAMKKGVFAGEELYYYTFDSDTKLITPMIIFSGGGKQTKNLPYENNAIYELSVGDPQYTGDTNGSVSGVSSIEADGNSLPAEYYNLHGVRVDNPTNGIYIRRQGDSTEKVIIR